MDTLREEQARFIHLLSSPLTAMRGAIDLLRQPRRPIDDPVARELLQALERSYVRLRDVVELLLARASVAHGQIEIVVPLDALLGPPDQPAPRAPTASLASPPAGSDNGSIRPGTVLIVEHTPAFRAAAAAALREADYTVIEAADGMVAVDLARLHRPDLIAIDLDLPRLSGTQIAQVLREDPETKTIPLIYTAGQPPLAQAPHSEVLPKTEAPAGLVDAVRRALIAARARASQAPALLVVDDDPDILYILTVALQIDNYRVITASTGAEALAYAQQHSFDLIILDLLLPDLDGFSVLGALRARPASAVTPIILLSARNTAREKVHGLQLGADDYVTKPFSADELLARVRAALRRSEREGGANPSTRLPGNIAIEQAIRRRIETSTPFAVCYVDLDNFKAYNDTYSFFKGDAVIQQTAHVLLGAIERHGNPDDFVGHIGGDDFVMITSPDRAELVCAQVIADFDAIAPLFYDPATRQRGYIDATDRQGRPASYPFVGLSIAVVSSARYPIQHPAEVAQRSADLKKRAKEIPGSITVFEE